MLLREKKSAALKPKVLSVKTTLTPSPELSLMVSKVPMLRISVLKENPSTSSIN